MRKRCKLLCAIVMSTAAVAIQPTYAGAKIEISDDAFVTVGAGFRYEIRYDEAAAPANDELDFNIANMRLYLGGQINEQVKFTFNTERWNGNELEVLDAIAQFEFSPAVNIWFGRMLTPADRVEMNGPFYGLSWNQYEQPFYPSDLDAPGDDIDGPAGALGRDEGVTFWGSLDKFQYAIGLFDGVDAASEDPLIAARFAYNFLNKEANPGYYTSSSYYGSLGDIFTVALAFQSQADVDTNADFSGYSVDVFYENALDNGDVLNIEGEYKDFESDTNTVGLFDGDSYYATFAYLFNNDDAYGEFQPYIRYVENNPNGGSSNSLSEFGLNYVISGHNTRLNFSYATGDATPNGGATADDRNVISFGVQLQL